MATAGLADIHNNSCWGRTVMRKKKATIGWQPPLDPKNKKIVVEAHLVAPVPGRVQDFDRLEWPPTERDTDVGREGSR